MKYKELEKKSLKDLQELNQKLREELFHLKLKNQTAQLTKKNQIQVVRKDIARVEQKIAELRKKA